MRSTAIQGLLSRSPEEPDDLHTLECVKALCEAYIFREGGGFAIGLVQNHSRQTLVALLADVA